ncbi:hypothetical protein ACU8KH_03346 [Lachancea thermotolerans]
MFSKENMIFMKDERLRRRSAAQNQRLLLSYKLKYNTSHNGGVLEIKEDPEALPNKPRIPELHPATYKRLGRLLCLPLTLQCQSAVSTVTRATVLSSATTGSHGTKEFYRSDIVEEGRTAIPYSRDRAHVKAVDTMLEQ